MRAVEACLRSTGQYKGYTMRQRQALNDKVMTGACQYRLTITDTHTTVLCIVMVQRMFSNSKLPCDIERKEQC